MMCTASLVIMSYGLDWVWLGKKLMDPCPCQVYSVIGLREALAATAYFCCAV